MKKHQDHKETECECGCTCEGKFPTFAVILLVLSALWLFSDLKILTINIPWIPIILIIVAIGMIFNRYKLK